MKSSTITIIIVIVGVGLLSFAMFGMGFEMGSSNQIPDHEIECLKQYGMSCAQYTAEQLKIRPNP